MKSKKMRDWSKDARRRESKTRQSSTRWKVYRDSEPQFVHEEVSDLFILWRNVARSVLCPFQRKWETAQRVERRRVSFSEDIVAI